MKQFTEKELLELKRQISECADSKKDPVSVYYTSMEVLQYARSLGEKKLPQLDMQFWAQVHRDSVFQMLETEGKMCVLFKEKMRREEALSHAKYFWAQDLGSTNWRDEYYKLLEESRDWRVEYPKLRQIAGIYLDILSADVEGERYQMWRRFYDNISDMISANRRGDDEDDQFRLSLPELFLLLKESELAAKFEKNEARCLLYWQPRINHFRALIRARVV